MNKISVSLNELTNENFFELDNAQELQISDELLQYLYSTKQPWQSLGKNLTNFINDYIKNIPIENRLRGKISPKAILENENEIVISEGAIIEAGAYISGPTIIEAGAIIRHGAYVRGSVYVSKMAIVGHTTECKGSILLPYAKAAHFNYVGDSILGHNSNLGAGTKLANLKLNHGLVRFKVQNEIISSGLKKFGAILGNRVQTGCNSVTNPGTLMFPDATIFPNQTASGIIVK